MDPLAPVCFASVAVLAVAAFVGGRRTGSWRAAAWVPIAVSALAAIGGLVWLQRRPEVEWRCLPHRPWAQLEHVSFLPFAALFFGVAWHRVPRASTRRALAVFLAFVAAIALLYGFARLALTRYEGLETEVHEGVVMQSTGYTCSAAAMATALTRRGIPASEDEMATLSWTIPLYGTNDFLSACAVERKLAGLPYRVDLRRMTWEELRAAPLPALVAMEWDRFTGHMSVVLGFQGEGRAEVVFLGDPAKGPYVLRKGQFLDRWYGYAILILPER